MRIELPSASWNNVLHRDDDAHTLTVAVQTATEWDSVLPTTDAGEALRASVPDTEPLMLTITF